MIAAIYPHVTPLKQREKRSHARYRAGTHDTAGARAVVRLDVGA
jgi:hypothetical protein